MKNSIVVKGRGIQKEGQALAAINPGHLVERTASGIQAHSTAAGNAAPAFAKELEVFGRDINTAYAADDTVIYEVFPPGAEVRAKLAASATAVTVGAYLESAGDGTLRIVSTSAATSQAQRAGVIARAVEAVDNSGGGTEAFIQVEVL